MSNKESVKHENDFPQSTEWIRIADQQTSQSKIVRRIVSAVPFFSGLSRHQYNELSGLFHLRKYKDGEIVFETGTPGLGMYVIIEGEVRIVGDRMGEEIELAMMKQGDFFGELSLVDEAARSATAIAKGDSHLLGIFRPQLQQLLQNRPKLGVILLGRLAAIVAKRLREADNLLQKSNKSHAGEAN
ncbi:cyclic nucleotide-binding domain-containing protein [Calditrichota bacterium]